MKKFFLVTLAMVLFFSLGFLIADALGYMDTQKVLAWIDHLHASPAGKRLVAVAVVVLLAIDLLLPIPSSVVMAAAGLFLGFWLGGMAAFMGAMLSACGGFLLCRWKGQKAFKRMVGSHDLGRIDQWFAHYGVYAIIISRPIPMLTEILSCLAGLSNLGFKPFVFASLLGTLPICFIYSYVGSRGDITNPWPAVWVAILIPAAGWLITKKINGLNPPD